MNHVYILGGLRSYIGVKDGMYRHIPAEKLGGRRCCGRWFRDLSFQPMRSTI